MFLSENNNLNFSMYQSCIYIHDVKQQIYSQNLIKMCLSLYEFILLLYALVYKFENVYYIIIIFLISNFFLMQDAHYLHIHNISYTV